MEQLDKLDLTEAITNIPPTTLSYQEWLNVGMALKTEGYSCTLWDDWSRGDPDRYHSGECDKKWNGFHGGGNQVTGGTIVKMAMDCGWRPGGNKNSDPGHSLDWDSTIGEDKDDFKVVDPSWVEPREVIGPKDFNPTEQLTRYLELLFDSTDTIGFVTKSWEKDGRWLPTKGSYGKLAGKLIEELSKCDGDIGAVIGDYNPEAGAWIRFNPLDGNGVKNENVTEFRYALVESDSMDIEKQNAIIRELELPVACLVHSGGKSLHAIVRIEATTYEEYRKRVDFLYTILKKNGLDVDTQNKNPSRLSRMPGVMRNGKPQYIVDSNIGKSSWAEWREWVDAINDDLPDLVELASVWDNLPDLAPSLIDGILRQGHKMLLAGPPKAGKSFSMLELCVAIAEGGYWLGRKCARGRVMYVNLELDQASCLHRFRDVYAAQEIAPNHLDNIEIWNLRGKSIPMDKLAPKLIRRASKKKYIAVVIDPIYKVITGDENSADQMAAFCNQFDKVCNELGCAVIYCHHHSKGAQGGKRSMDRASGSGVFARDPDALLDMTELEISDDMLTQLENNSVCAACTDWLDENITDWRKEASQDDLCSQRAMLDICQDMCSAKRFSTLLEVVEQARKSVKQRTAWRIEGTLREFPKFDPINIWFEYPVHRIDENGALDDLEPDDGFTQKGAPWKRNFTKKKTPQEREKERKDSLETAFEAVGIDGKVTVKELADYMSISEKTVRRRLKEHGKFWVDGSEVGTKD